MSERYRNPDDTSSNTTATELGWTTAETAGGDSNVADKNYEEGAGYTEPCIEEVGVSVASVNRPSAPDTPNMKYPSGRTGV